MPLRLLDAVLPARCAACWRPAPGLCAACRHEAEALRLPGGGPTMLGPAVAAVAAFAYDGVVARAIREVKVPGRHHAAADLGRLLWSAVGGVLGPAAVWPRTWVPSTRRRLRQRGADVPRLLAGASAVRVLERMSQDSDQTDLSGAQRRTARRGEFRCTGRSPSRVVLVDDVRTTGGTARAAADALRTGGARRILVVTLAAVMPPGAPTSKENDCP